MLGHSPECVQRSLREHKRWPKYFICPDLEVNLNYKLKFAIFNIPLHAVEAMESERIQKNLVCSLFAAAFWASIKL